MDVTVPAKALRELERMIQGYTSNEPVALRLMKPRCCLT
jgi:DNA polymerase-3 subunit beta